MLMPATTAAAAPLVRMFTSATEERGCLWAASSSRRLKPLPAGWNPEPTAAVHKTWDDRRSWRSRRAALLLQSIRSCGTWELHLCHFGRKVGERRSEASTVSLCILLPRMRSLC